MKATICYPAADVQKLFEALLDALPRKDNVAPAIQKRTVMEDGIYLTTRVPAMFDHNEVCVEVLGFEKLPGYDLNGWDGPMSSGNWVRARIAVDIDNIWAVNFAAQRQLRDFGKRTGAFMQLFDEGEWEWAPVDCPFNGVDSDKENLLTILGPDNSATADDILKDREIAVDLKEFLDNYLEEKAANPDAPK